MSDDPGLRIAQDEQAGVAEAERLVKEAEFGARELRGWSFWISGALALTMTAFQLWTSAVGALPPRLPWYDLPFAALGAYASLYVTLHYEALPQRAGTPEPMDIAVGVVLILLLLPGPRRPRP